MSINAEDSSLPENTADSLNGVSYISLGKFDGEIQPYSETIVGAIWNIGNIGELDSQSECSNPTTKLRLEYDYQTEGMNWKTG